MVAAFRGMAGAARPSTTSLPLQGKDVDADLRQHDSPALSGTSMSRPAGIIQTARVQLKDAGPPSRWPGGAGLGPTRFKRTQAVSIV